jgi:hypothetical protein
LPVAFDLAGGYSANDKVLDLHRATAEEAIRVEKARAKR